MDQLEFPAVPPHGRSDLAATIATLGAADPADAAGRSEAGPVSAAERAIVEVAHLDQPAAANEMPVGLPSTSGKVAPGGDVEPWEVLEPAARAPVPVTLVVSNPPSESSALDGVREALVEMHREGVATVSAAPGSVSVAAGPFDLAVRAGQAAASTVASMSEPPAESFLPAEVSLQAGTAPPARVGISDPERQTTPAISSPHSVQTLEPPEPWRPSIAPVGLEDTDGPTSIDDRTSTAAPTSVHSAPPGAQSMKAAAPGDDDFGPLLDPGTPRSSRGERRSAASGRRRRSPSRQILLFGLVGLLCVGMAVGMLLLRPTGGTPPAAAAAGSPAAAPDVTWRDWHGISLPISAADGPATWGRDGDQVAGFAETRLGAAIAAAHLSVRVDPLAGEAVWRQVLDHQVAGDRARLAAALEAADPSPSDAIEPGSLVGWRLDGDPASGDVAVHLGVAAADDSVRDYTVGLTWVGGDWALKIPASGPFFPIGQTMAPYAPFRGEQ